jgi:hypothetical protein
MEHMWLGSRPVLIILFIHFATKLEMSFITHEVVHEGSVCHLQLQ